MHLPRALETQLGAGQAVPVVNMTGDFQGRGDMVPKPSLLLRGHHSFFSQFSSPRILWLLSSGCLFAVDPLRFCPQGSALLSLSLSCDGPLPWHQEQWRHPYLPNLILLSQPSPEYLPPRRFHLEAVQSSQTKKTHYLSCKKQAAITQTPHRGTAALAPSGVR